MAERVLAFLLVIGGILWVASAMQADPDAPARDTATDPPTPRPGPRWVPEQAGPAIVREPEVPPPLDEDDDDAPERGGSDAPVARPAPERRGILGLPLLGRR